MSEHVAKPSRDRRFYGKTGSRQFVYDEDRRIILMRVWANRSDWERITVFVPLRSAVLTTLLALFAGAGLEGVLRI